MGALWVIAWLLMGILAALIGYTNGKNVALMAILGFLLGPIGIVIAAFPKGEE